MASVGDPGAERGESRPLGAVLAGGASSRLGGTKATVELAGRPLISYPLASLEAAGIEAAVVAKSGTELPPLACPVLLEPEEPRHPLCGIVAALREAGRRPLVALACDMPFASPDLLAELAAAPEPLVVPAPGGRPQPLQARYSAVLLTALAHEEALRRSVESLSPRLLADPELRRFGDPEGIFFNVNDPAALRAAAVMLDD
jgi:molybdopterin-guanine dinucleotide biosynthesis protein A